MMSRFAAVVVVLATTTAAAAAPVLTPVFAHAGGEVLDADATRILYVDGSAMLRVRLRASGSETVIGPIASAGLGRLTAAGAYFASIDGASGCPAGQALYAWTGSGAPVEVDRACTTVAERWQFAGDWGVRRDSPVRFTRRNLATGATDVAVFPTVGSPARGQVETYAIGDAGDVYGAWTSGTGGAGFTYYRERAGALETTASNTGSAWGFAASGDAYVTASCGQAGTPCSTVRCLGLRTDCVELPVGLSVGVQLADGWAFGDGEDTAIVSDHRIGRLSPTGTADEVGEQGDVLEAAAGGGALTLQRGGDRYLVRADGTADRVNPFVGRARFLPDAPYLMLGDTLYRIDDGPAAIDAGADPDAATDPDAASAPDAGSSFARTNDGCAAAPAPGALPLLVLALLLTGRRRTRA